MTESMASEPAEPTTRQDLTGQMSSMLRSAREETWSDNRCAMAARALATRVESGDFNEDDSGLLADPAQTTELEDRAELADQLASANEHIEEQDARISQLEAEVVKQRIIAKNATDHWRQSSILASLRAANAQRGLELRKLNLAMARKNRVIAKRESERDLALWLHAEENWLHGQALAIAHGNALRWEERQARIDAAVQLIHVFTATGPHFLSPDETRAVRAALVGDQPTPVVACECFVVPEEQWTRHGDATDPGSQFEQNPDCPVHPAKQADDAAGDLP